MTYVIGAGCIDVTDRSCVEVCPVDCIYEGKRKLYIQPDECVDCGACEPVCPENAIFYAPRAPISETAHLDDAKVFFYDTLAGQSVELGMPGGARDVDPLGVDTPMVRDWA
ncbi:ferredoxin [Streptomyces sp. NBC_01618]|uniref:ferredoxin n=1 Tax=Streptomyces sp. NBC_01618 TaxID=2975900 RepID=UPI003870A907|nr:ferredoxin family protein [Streptomyces sp. NBC_01618]